MSMDSTTISDNKGFELLELRDKALNSYATYCMLMQDDGYFDRVHRYLCDWVQMHVERAEATLRVKDQVLLELAFVMPRGSLKSTIVTKHLPSWITLRRKYLFHDDSTRSLIAGNTFTNAKKKMRGIRGVFDSNVLFKALFPEVVPTSKETWSDESASIPRSCGFDESTFECAGTNTKLTGRHYNIIIEDDTTAPDVDEMKEEFTKPDKETIEKAIGFHKASGPLFVPKGFRLSVVVSTRWSFYDLIHHIKEKEHYYVFNMPAFNPSGDCNFDRFYDKEQLEKIKGKIGPYMFNMLYLNNPLEDGERIFNAKYFQWKNLGDIPKGLSFTIAVDPAISEKDTACESSITVSLHEVVEGPTGRKAVDYWVQDINIRAQPFKLANSILDIAERWEALGFHCSAIIIETVAYQMALRYVILNEMERRKKRFAIIDFNSRQSKNLRIQSLEPSLAEGRIFFLRYDKGLGVSPQTISQLLDYPDGNLVDTIDSWSMHRKVWVKDYVKEPEEDLGEFGIALKEIKARQGLGLLVDRWAGVAGLGGLLGRY